MDNDFFIKVPNKYIKTEEQMNDYELLTYILIKRNFLYGNTCTFNLLELTRLINKTDKKKYKDDMKHFKDSLIKFQKDGVFQFFSDKNLINQIDINEADNNYLIYSLELEDVDGEFTKISDVDIDYIIKNIGDTKISIYGVCHYFAYLISFIYENSTSQQFGYCTQNRTLADIGLCKESKSKYEMYIEQIKLMKFEVLGSVKTNGEYKTSKTYFCRYNEKGISDLAYEVERLLKEKDLIILDEDKKKKINEKRQNTATINYLQSVDDKTEDQVKRLNKLLKRNQDLTNIKKVEIEKVKPKEEEEKPKHKGIGIAKKEDYWGEPVPINLEELREDIKNIVREIRAMGEDKETIMELLGDRTIKSENIKELNSIKFDLNIMLKEYEDLPY